MRQLRFFIFLLVFPLCQYSHATPVRYDVTGIMTTSASNGNSPIANGASITGWYELDWDQAQFGTTLGNGAIYTGILSYYFDIDNQFTLKGSSPNIEYFSETLALATNSPIMQFRDQSPALFIKNFLPIEDLFFTISNHNGNKSVSLDYYSVPDFDNGDNVYIGWCDLLENHTNSVPEPSIFLLMLTGLAVLCLRKAKQKI